MAKLATARKAITGNQDLMVIEKRMVMGKGISDFGELFTKTVDA
jgi:hypothetical protein